MKKKIFTFLCFIFMTFGLMTGCGGFVDDESLVITSITTEVLEDGRTMVVITYDDEELKPSIFYIPQGEEGEVGPQGDGIKNIEYEYDDNGDYILTITFTNPEMEPLVLPLKNGISVVGVTSEVDEETGTTYVTVNFSDGTSSDPIEIPKGEKGEDGSVIINYGVIPNEETGGQTLFFMFSTGEMVTVEIPKPDKGEDGRGIKAIIATEDDEYYYLTFEFTDDSEPQKVKFQKPEDPNTWHSGYEKPANSLGKNGDYYFDLSSNDIYHKLDGIWVLIIDFDSTETLCTVTFDLNGEGAYLPAGYNYQLYHAIPKGTNFASNGSVVPIPARDGYTFNGWYTSQNPSVVHGSFNDLTTVSSDLKLYANWIKNI